MLTSFRSACERPLLGPGGNVYTGEFTDNKPALCAVPPPIQPAMPHWVTSVTSIGPAMEFATTNDNDQSKYLPSVVAYESPDTQ